MDQHLENIAKTYVEYLCQVKPNRRTGSKGNKNAVQFFKNIISKWDYTIDTTHFSCLDYIDNGSTLQINNSNFEVFTSPFSLPCHITSPLSIASTINELKSVECNGKILLLKKEICKEQLMPKKFIFYNPERHQKIYQLLEKKQPTAIITATTKNEEMVGNFYPFPLFEDGDFNIPSVYCTDKTGDKIEQINKENKKFDLDINAKRISSRASNVIGKMNNDKKEKIVICAHIDARDTTPGASDNASGTSVLLLLAEMLQTYDGPYEIEIIAFNGEDYYSVGGQMDYLSRYGHELDSIKLAINIDDVGYKEGDTCFSFYNCSEKIKTIGQQIVRSYEQISLGNQWFQGDHMIFVQKEIPSIAFTSEKSMELLRTITHTKYDTPSILDYSKLVVLARALNEFIRKI